MVTIHSVVSAYVHTNCILEQVIYFFLPVLFSLSYVSVYKSIGLKCIMCRYSCFRNHTLYWKKKKKFIIFPKSLFVLCGSCWSVWNVCVAGKQREGLLASGFHARAVWRWRPKVRNILQMHTHDIKPKDKPSNISLFALGWWWLWRSPSACLL